MKITPEMMAEDERRWVTRDVIAELGYCGNHMCDRTDMTNLDIRFYAYLMRKAHDMLKAQMPRVLEYSEIEKHPLVWLEDSDKEDVIPALFLQYNGWNAEFSRQAPYVDKIIRSAIVIAVEKMYGYHLSKWRFSDSCASISLSLYG
jgi:hypothetical protein